MTDEDVAKMAAGWVRATEINDEKKNTGKELQMDINVGLADDKKWVTRKI